MNPGSDLSTTSTRFVIYTFSLAYFVIPNPRNSVKTPKKNPVKSSKIQWNPDQIKIDQRNSRKIQWNPVKSRPDKFKKNPVKSSKIQWNPDQIKVNQSNSVKTPKKTPLLGEYGKRYKRLYFCQISQFKTSSLWTKHWLGHK